MIEKIKKMVEDGLSLDDISTRKRDRKLSVARCVYVRICKENTSLTLNEIGKTIDRDYNTVSYLNRTFDTHIWFEKEAKNVYERITARIKNTDSLYSIIEDIPDEIKEEILTYIKNKIK